MGKIEKLLNKTIEGKGQFWRIVVSMIVAATVIVALASFGFRSCTSSLVEATWTTPSAEQAETSGTGR